MRHKIWTTPNFTHSHLIKTHSGEFVFDDTVAIVQNQDVTHGTTLRGFFAHDFWGG
jgi:hypothetical protein